MTDPLLTAAVRNNAEWCDAVVGARGHAGVFTERLWVNLHPAPPYYPNIITLLPTTPDLVDELRLAIADVRAHVDGQIGVKDSYADLDLYGLDLNVLFDAAWHTRPAGAPIENGDTDLDWRPIKTAEGPTASGEASGSALRSDIQAWQLAWDADVTTGPNGPVFAPALLDDPNIAFLAGFERGEIVAGVIANSHAGALGLSNLFTRHTHIREDWRNAVTAAVNYFRGLPVVGYGPAAARPLAESLGYSTLGSLRIWTG